MSNRCICGINMKDNRRKYCSKECYFAVKANDSVISTLLFELNIKLVECQRIITNIERHKYGHSITKNRDIPVYNAKK